MINSENEMQPICKIGIEKLTVEAYKIPTNYPETDGTLDWDSTTLILVHITAGGKTGIGYTYADSAAAHLINHNLSKLILGKNAMDIPAITGMLIHETRNNGITGIGMMAISAIDVALWDLKARIMNLPLATLLGMQRQELLVYGSGGFTSYTDDQLQEQLNGWIKQGINNVKVKIGRNRAKDIHKIALSRKIIGPEAGLFVDANGAYSVKQAADSAQLFSEYNISWFEEPVSSDNLEGLHFLRGHVPPQINITAGEYGYNPFYFKNMLDAGAVDIIQADATRCGGISGFLRAAYIAEAYMIPFSSHCAPALHLHAALSLPGFFIAEYFHDHARIENMLFDGAPQPVNGYLKPDMTRAGMGLEFKHSDAERYKI